MKRKILLICLLGLFAFAVSGCFSMDSVDSIELVGTIKTEFEVGENIDLSSITIKANYADETSIQLSGDNSALSITGFDTSTAGAKSMVIKYEGVSLTVQYTVYSAGTSAANSGLFEGLLSNSTGTIRLNGNVEYAGLGTIAAPIVVNYPVTVVGSSSNEAGIVITGASFKTSGAGSMTFKNVTFKNCVYTQGGTFNFENCKFVVTGKEYTGINSNSKQLTNLALDGCTFVTENETDCFYYLIQNNKLNSTNVIKNSTFICNFWYGISVGYYFLLDNCTLNSTLAADTSLKDSKGASYVNANKQPVALHCYSVPTKNAAGEYMLDYTIKNCTFKNLQNVMRVYQLDYVEDANFKFVWTNNDTSVNCNYMVNFSIMTYASEARLLAVLGNVKVRYVAQNNTALTKVGTVSLIKDLVNGLFRYRGFNYEDKNGDLYEYLGYNGTFHVIAKENVEGVKEYFSLKTDYSADGLDTRTITKLDVVPNWVSWE